MTLENSSDRGKGINAEFKERSRKDFFRQQCEKLTLDPNRDYLKGGMDNKELIDYLKPKERENLLIFQKNGMWNTQKEILAAELYHTAQKLKQDHKESYIEEELNKIREQQRYKQAYGDESSSSQQQNKSKELDPMEAQDKAGPSDHLRPLNQVGQRQATLTEQHEVHDQADPRHQTSDHLRPRDQQTAPDNEKKKPIDFLKPEERQNFASGAAESIKKKLAEQILHLATSMKALSHTDSEIDQFLNTVPREWPLYKLYYGNGASSSQHQREINEASLPQHQREINEASLPQHQREINEASLPQHQREINEASLPQHQREINEASSSQQHIEIIVLSDSEEDGEKSPKQKQPSESRTHEREKWQSDQAQEETSPNTGQRIDSATHQYQLYEQQQSKGKELDTMEIHDKIGSSDYLRLLDQFGQGLATLTEQHEVHDQADPTRQADASSHSDHLGVDLDVVFGSVEFRDSKVEELNKKIQKCDTEIQKCKDYHKEKNREIEKKRENIAKIYHKNKMLVPEHIENVTNDLSLQYQRRVINDLRLKYSKTPLNDFISKFSEMYVDNLLKEYKEQIENDLFSKHNKKSINDLSSKHKEDFINGLILEYKEGIKNAQKPEEVKKIEGELISKYNSKGFDTKSSEELIKSVREIHNLQELIQTNQHLISFYERQREEILSGRHETSNQAGASSLADPLGASLDNLDLEFGDLEFREPHDQIQATSSQSFPEIRQPFAAHNPAEAQRESTSQLADVRRQDQIEQRQDTIVQQHERYDQAGPSIKEAIKHRLIAFVDNLIEQKGHITEKKVATLLQQNNIYTQKDLLLYHNCTVELYNEAPNQPLKRRYESIIFHIRQRLPQ